MFCAHFRLEVNNTNIILVFNHLILHAVGLQLHAVGPLISKFVHPLFRHSDIIIFLFININCIYIREIPYNNNLQDFSKLSFGVLLTFFKISF